MKYIDSLPVKYLTETHRIFKDYPCDVVDIIFDLSKEIIKSRKSKKNWNKEDFVFEVDLCNNLFKKPDLLQTLIESEYIIANDNNILYSITDKALSLIYIF